MRVIYIGGMTGGIDVPEYGITGWKPGEARDVPAPVTEELLGRGDFEREPVRKRAEPV